MHPVAHMKPSAMPNPANTTNTSSPASSGGSFDLLMALSLALDQFVATPEKNQNENAEIIPINHSAEMMTNNSMAMPDIFAEPEEDAKGNEAEADALALLIASSPLAPLFQQTSTVDVTQPVTDLKTPTPTIPTENTQATAEGPHEVVVPVQPEQTWNLRDLAWQLRAALRQVAAENPAAGHAQPGVRPNPLGKPATTLKNRVTLTNFDKNAPAEKMADPRFTPSAEPHLFRGGKSLETAAVEVPDFKFGAPARQNLEVPEIPLSVSQSVPQTIEAANGEIETSSFVDGASFAEQMREIAEVIGDRAHGAIKVGDKGVEATMRLYPPDLGNVRVALQVQHDSTVQAQFIAERPETAALIQKHLPQLQESFARQGLVVERIQVTTSISATVQTSDSATPNNQQQPEGRARHFWQDQRRPHDQRQQGSAFEEFLG